MDLAPSPLWLYRPPMPLEVLCCPNCQAPVEGLRGAQTICRYCGATLVAGTPATARTETHYALVLRVGPSNVERIAALLAARLGLAPHEARSRLTSPPCAIELGTDEHRAHALAREVVHAGAQADLAERVVEIPQVNVHLDGAGPNPLATVVALRQHLELGVQEARQLVARAPVIVASALDEPLARELVAALERAGARARATSG